MKKRTQVIRLATDSKSGRLWETTSGHLMHTHTSGVFRETYTPFHLYFVDDSEINEGDWYYWPVTRSVLRFKMTEIERKGDNPHPSKDCKKVIATTDSSLEVTNDKDSVLLNNLPQPSQSFIEEYCKLGGVGLVDVEYENTSKGWQSIANHEAVEEWFLSSTVIPDNWVVKVNSNNEITTHFIKEKVEKVYTREEVQDAVICALMDRYNEGSDFRLQDWLKRNL